MIVTEDVLRVVIWLIAALLSACVALLIYIWKTRNAEHKRFQKYVYAQFRKYDEFNEGWRTKTELLESKFLNTADNIKSELDFLKRILMKFNDK